MAGRLAGRDRELAVLVEGMSDIRSGRSAMVLVAGEAGIGKSRLVEELAAIADGTEARVAWGRCSEAGGAPAYWPWIQVIRSVAKADEAADLLHRVGYADVATAAVPSTAEAMTQDQGERFRLFDDLLSTLVAAAANVPRVIILDDLHAADDSSLLLLRFIAQHRPPNVLIVGTYRRVEAAIGPAGTHLFDIARAATVVNLEGLDEGAVSDLLEDAGASVNAARDVREASGGNPLFVTEIARVLATGERSRLPPSVRPTTASRLALLQSSERAIVEAASILGRHFDVAQVAGVTGQPATTVRRALEAAAVLHLVEDGAPGGWRFVHDLLREAVVAELDAARRAELHRTAAAMLAKVAEHRATEIAHHAWEGGAPDALERCRTAADRALTGLAYEDAVVWYERALELTPVDDLATRFDLLSALANAAHRAGDISARVRYASESAPLARALDDPTRFAQAALGIAGYCDARYDPERILALEEAIARLPNEPSALRARVLIELAQNLYVAASFGGPDRSEEGLALSGHALEMAREVDDEATIVHCLYGHHFVLMHDLDSLDERMPLARELVERSIRLGDPVWQCIARGWLANDLIEAGEVLEAEVELIAAGRVANELHQPFTSWATTYPRAGLALLRGELAEAERLAMEAYAHGVRTGFRDASAVHVGLLFAIRRAQGRLPEVIDEIGIVSNLAGLDDPAGEQIDPLIGAIFMAESGDLGAGRRLLQTVQPKSAWAYVTSVAVRADAAWTCDDPSSAQECYEALLPYRNRFVLLAFLVSTGGSVELHLGLLAALLQRTDVATGHFAVARQQHERFGATMLLAQIDAAEGRMWHHAGRADLADPLLARARRAYETMGMSLHVLRMEALLSSAEPASEPSETATGSASFLRDGDGWTICFDDRPAFHVADAVGLGYLRRLLGEPGRELHCLELAGTNDATLDGDVGPGLDERAKAAYRERLADLDRELAEADANHDLARSEQVAVERDFLIRELSAAVGLGGRDRATGAAAERARVAVTRAIRRAVDRLASIDAGLGAHLRATVRTGVYCSYQPDPRYPTRWDT